jgi:hypothetical protein
MAAPPPDPLGGNEVAINRRVEFFFTGFTLSKTRILLFKSRYYVFLETFDAKAVVFFWS